MGRGVDINARDDRDRTPLHLAAAEGHVEIVRLLIDQGADINAEANVLGMPLTPLEVAAIYKRYDIFVFLKDRGATGLGDSTDDASAEGAATAPSEEP